MDKLDKEVLTGIVVKVIESKFNLKSLFDEDVTILGWEISDDELQINIRYSGGICGYECFSLPDLIDNDDFMQAVFGSELICSGCGCIKTGTGMSPCGNSSWLSAYHYRMQRLIILTHSEQIGYLKRFLEECKNDKLDNK